MTTVVEAPPQVPTFTQAQVIEALDETWKRTETIMNRLRPALDSGPDAGGWTPRQVLTHLIGSWELDAVRMGYFLEDEAKDRNRIVPHFDYWKAEYENAPFISYYLAMRKAYLGLRALVQELTDEELARPGHVNGRANTLGAYLVFSATGHRGDFHLSQLEAFLA